MRYLSVFLLALAAAGLAANARATSYTITADLWMQPRSGAVLLGMPPVHQAVQDWMRHPGSKLVIQHSGDEVGNLWASEVEDWLVSLGIPSADIQSEVSGKDENSVTLTVQP
ncbi:MAG: hypothetical protein ACRETQ_02870 [Gammaproteobacteria bacterium]